MEENSKIISAEDVETQQTDDSIPDKYCMFKIKILLLGLVKQDVKAVKQPQLHI